jgi:hypothetical protein
MLTCCNIVWATPLDGTTTDRARYEDGEDCWTSLMFDVRSHRYVANSKAFSDLPTTDNSDKFRCPSAHTPSSTATDLRSLSAGSMGLAGTTVMTRRRPQRLPLEISPYVSTFQVDKSASNLLTETAGTPISRVRSEAMETGRGSSFNGLSDDPARSQSAITHSKDSEAIKLDAARTLLSLAESGERERPMWDAATETQRR